MSIPAGLVTLRFCFTGNALSSNALLAFAGGDGLPSGFGVKPSSAVAQIKPPGEALKTVAATEDAPGLYHVELLALTTGEWEWEGQGLNGEGKLVMSTGQPAFTFTIEPTLNP